MPETSVEGLPRLDNGWNRADFSNQTNLILFPRQGCATNGAPLWETAESVEEFVIRLSRLADYGVVLMTRMAQGHMSNVRLVGPEDVMRMR